MADRYQMEYICLLSELHKIFIITIKGEKYE